MAARILRRLNDAADDLLRFLVPETCIVCGRPLVKGECHVCLHCLSTLPRTGIHSDGFTPLHQRLAHTGVLIDRLAAWFYYVQGSPFNAIITIAKYSDRPSLSRMSGRIFASEILASGFFADIDLLLPVPLALTKELKRGYNQSREIARGISQVTGIPVANLLKARRHSTQTRKGAYARFLNSRSVFSVKKKAPALMQNRHILLIDDVLTTGATILACAEAIAIASPGTRISVLTLGATRIV